MGSLKRFNLKRISRLYNCEYFFETGTWKGDGVAYAAKFHFKKIFSSEIVPEFAKKAAQRFESFSSVEIINQNSLIALENKLPEIDGNCIFWLDAHYPGADEGILDYNEEQQEDIRLPLEKEIELISKRIDSYCDVIIIDDLRIYEQGDFKYGNIPTSIIPPKNRNIDFIFKYFKTSHNIFKSYEDEGYVYLVPKTIFQKEQFSIFNRLIKKINKQIL
ncbi:MAG: hypothetical protein JST62_01225 [Bacteroidetes bacterium]|nr:hypothetical protein [Bacteroidota bacterium]